MKKIILYSLALLSISSCTKNTDVIESTTIVYQYISPNYLIKEDFEMGKKAAYAIGDVAIKTGSWSFDDALLGQLTTDIKIARAQGNNSPFKSDGLGGVDKQTFDRIKTLIVDGLGVDPSKNALFDQELKVNILKNLDVLSTINELQNQITKAQISAGKDQILAEPFIKQVTDQIRERLNQLSPETRDPRAPEKFVSPASGQLGSNLSRGFVDDFKTGFSDTLKGKITGKEFGTRITDAFTSRVVDSFASRAIDTVFSGDAFANIFGGTGQVGEISGNLFNKLFWSELYKCSK